MILFINQSQPIFKTLPLNNYPHLDEPQSLHVRQPS
jgi:hypothetical protein